MCMTAAPDGSAPLTLSQLPPAEPFGAAFSLREESNEEPSNYPKTRRHSGLLRPWTRQPHGRRFARPPLAGIGEANLPLSTLGSRHSRRNPAAVNQTRARSERRLKQARQAAHPTKR